MILNKLKNLLSKPPSNTQLAPSLVRTGNSFQPFGVNYNNQFLSSNVGVPQEPIYQQNTGYNFTPEQIDRLIQAESSGNPKASAVGYDKKMYRGLLGLGQAAWEDVNKIRKQKNLPTYTYKQVDNPRVNREYGTTYLNEVVPNLLKNQGLPVNPITGLIHYSGRTSNYLKAGSDFSKLDPIEQQKIRDYVGKIGYQL